MFFLCDKWCSIKNAGDSFYSNDLNKHRMIMLNTNYIRSVKWEKSKHLYDALVQVSSDLTWTLDLF